MSVRSWPRARLRVLHGCASLRLSVVKLLLALAVDLCLCKSVLILCLRMRMCIALVVICVRRCLRKRERLYAMDATGLVLA